jgi:hypothetical protein
MRIVGIVKQQWAVTRITAEHNRLCTPLRAVDPVLECVGTQQSMMQAIGSDIEPQMDKLYKKPGYGPSDLA